MGSWELFLDIEVESRQQLRDILREMKEKFRDIITRVEPNEVYQMDKFTQMAIEYPNLLKEYESKNKKDSKESKSSQEDTPQKATEEDLYY
jgi:hypothetical protein